MACVHCRAVAAISLMKMKLVGLSIDLYYADGGGGVGELVVVLMVKSLVVRQPHFHLLRP